MAVYLKYQTQTLHTLLLNFTYECINFIPERRAFKLLSKENKVEVISSWDNKIRWMDGKYINHPAILRLKRHVRWIPRQSRFNRINVFRRDQFCCQYCGAALTFEEATIDHIIPRAQGGVNNWKNCVCSCFPCNRKKGNQTPEQAGLILKSNPVIPQMNISADYCLLKNKHDSWKDFIR